MYVHRRYRKRVISSGFGFLSRFGPTDVPPRGGTTESYITRAHIESSAVRYLRRDGRGDVSCAVTRDETRLVDYWAFHSGRLRRSPDPFSRRTYIYIYRDIFFSFRFFPFVFPLRFHAISSYTLCALALFNAIFNVVVGHADRLPRRTRRPVIR